MKSTVIGVVIVGAAAAAVAFKPHATKEDAEAAMDRATRFAETNGNAALVQSLQKANSPLHGGATRVLVIDLAGNVVADPVQPQRVGRNVLDLKDTHGNYLFVDALQVANARGEGWVYYKTRSPLTWSERREAALVKRHGDVVLLATLND